MAIMEAGRTEHIVVNYDDSRGPDAGSRAQMLLGSCEADLMRLERDYFRIAGIFEPPSPPLLVVVSSGSFASNNGYDPHRQSTITIETFPVALDQDLADETVRMLFVAEAAEVLMEFLNVLAQRWHSRLSDGEGLSRVLAAEFYPDAYYGAMIHGPFGNAWLTDASRIPPRPEGGSRATTRPTLARTASAARPCSSTTSAPSWDTPGTTSAPGPGRRSPIPTRR